MNHKTLTGDSSVDYSLLTGFGLHCLKDNNVQSLCAWVNEYKHTFKMPLQLSPVHTLYSVSSAIPKFLKLAY